MNNLSRSDSDSCQTQRNFLQVFNFKKNHLEPLRGINLLDSRLRGNDEKIEKTALTEFSPSQELRE